MLAVVSADSSPWVSAVESLGLEPDTDKESLELFCINSISTVLVLPEVELESSSDDGRDKLSTAAATPT